MNTHIYINSINRSNTLDPKNQVKIKLNQAIDASCAELSFFQMPNTWYNVTENNNTFSHGEDTITVPPGSYDLNQLLTQVQSLLPSGTVILYNDVLNLINITLPAPQSLGFGSSDFHILLGFLPQTYAVNTSFTSSYPPKIYSSVILVKTNLGSNMVSDKGYTSSFIVPVNVNKSELLQFYNRSQFSIRPKVNNNAIHVIEIILFDEYEHPLIGCGDFVAIIAVNEKNPANDY